MRGLSFDLEAIIGRVQMELPNISSVSQLSENASCYQNNLLPVIAPFNAKGHGMVLQGIVHSETQRGKSLVDAHFAVVLRQVDKLVNDTTINVSTPGTRCLHSNTEMALKI